MKKVGRPVQSEIRQNIVDILAYMKEGYAYSIYKVYREVFPAVTMRSIYYHLKKGVSIGEFRVSKIIKETGEYSWGGEAEKIYYALGESANPRNEARIRSSAMFASNNAVSSEKNPLEQKPLDE